jgi:hypothetical protein
MKVSDLWPASLFIERMGGDPLWMLLPQDSHKTFKNPPAVHWLCPFCRHEDADSTVQQFEISFETGDFNCEHCGKKGDVIDYLILMNHSEEMDRDTAIYRIAYKYNIYPELQIGIYYDGSMGGGQFNHFLVLGVTKDNSKDGEWRVLYRQSNLDFGLMTMPLLDLTNSLDNDEKPHYSYCGGFGKVTLF